MQKVIALYYDLDEMLSNIFPCNVLFRQEHYAYIMPYTLNPNIGTFKTFLIERRKYIGW